MTDMFGERDGTALAELVRQREVTPVELVEAAIARIEALDGRLNAVVTRQFERALEQARGELPDGPFRGVPFLLKDLHASDAGVRLTGGTRALAGYVPRHDAELTRRYKRAGLVIVGRTSTPELGIVPTTEPALFGPCRNPWDTARSTGGSSGGSAAAVAARMVPMAHASDGGGSIRIPASCCGLFGLKPTRARNPLGPDSGDGLSGLVSEHALTRSVRDSAALLDATSGPDLGDPYWAPPPARPFRDEVGVDPGVLRIAVSSSASNGAEVHADCVAALESTVALLRELGHQVEDASPPLEGPQLSRAFVTIWAAGVAASVGEIALGLGREPGEDELEPLTRALVGLSAQTHAHHYLMAIGYLQRVARKVARFLEGYDAWLTPTLAEPPAPLGTFDATADNPLAGFMRAGLYCPFTPIANVTGGPAMSVPLHWNEAGLPIGVQFIGRFGDEATLLRLASQLEQARPWRDRRPPVS